jgi:hypothetical protein
MPLSIPIPTDAVSEIKGGGYMVSSRSLSNENGEAAFRLVWGNECSCPATGPSCRHRKLVAAFCAKQDAARRPTRVPSATSLMCD